MRNLRLLLAAVAVAGCSRESGAGSLPAAFSPPGLAAPLSGTHKYSTLYSFNPLPDGAWATTALAHISGTLYGTTYGGGQTPASGPCKDGCGTVYAITPLGAERVAYSFQGRPDGAIPEGGLTSLGGAIYGTTFYGGNSNSNKCSTALGNRGCGTIFILTSSGERVLYSFNGGADGANPDGKLRVINGTLYGTTSGGLIGTNCPSTKTSHGTIYGTVFKISRDGAGYKVLYRFRGHRGASVDGACPIGDLAETNGILYGVTFAGGAGDGGTVWALPFSGNGHRDKIVHAFTSAEGDEPTGVVVSSAGGKAVLYGAASSHGMFRRGAIFSVTPGGKFAIEHSFKGNPKSDGALPFAPPLAMNGDLFGTTEGGGKYGVGSVYRIQLGQPKGECVLHSFAGERTIGGKRQADGSQPSAAVFELNGTLYGTTVLGGAYYGSLHGLGTVFSISPTAACEQ